THSSGAARGMRTMADPQPPQPVARIAQQDEAGLVARAVAGERAAFGILVERYAGVARRVARAVLGNAEDADDAAQDAMLSAILGIPEGTVRSEVFHARRRLRVLLADWKEEA